MSNAGVPKLNRPELEAACEDFSNIIDNCDDHTIYKGILSNEVEIAVVSTTVTSSNEWSKDAEVLYKKQVAYFQSQREWKRKIK